MESVSASSSAWNVAQCICTHLEHQTVNVFYLSDYRLCKEVNRVDVYFMADLENFKNLLKGTGNEKKIWYWYLYLINVLYYKIFKLLFLDTVILQIVEKKSYCTFCLFISWWNWLLVLIDYFWFHRFWTMSVHANMYIYMDIPYCSWREIV